MSSDQLTLVSYQLATAQESKPARRVGGKFYQATIFDVYIPSEATQMLLSSNSDGTGDIRADDKAVIIATPDNKDKKQATFKYNFSKDCIINKSQPPMNLFNSSGFDKLKATKGTKGIYVSVEIQFWDVCGALTSSTNFFLTIK